MKTIRTTLRLLREFTSDEPELGVSDLARRLRLDKATVHRMLASLAAERVVEQDPVSKRYRLGLTVLDLAATRMQSFHFLSAAVVEIQQIRNQVGESAGIHVRDDHEMVCLEFAESQQSVRVGFWIGERSAVHLTGTGLAALATLDPALWQPIVARSIAAYPDRAPISESKADTLLKQARKSGYGIANETFERGVRSIAVPVCDASAVAICTLSIAAPAQRRSEAELKRWLPLLREAAERIQQSLLGQRQSVSAVQRLGVPAIRRKV